MREPSFSTIARLVDVVADINIKVRMYLFGSTLTDTISPNDVDVLIVYPNGRIHEAALLVDALRRLDVIPPIDVLALSEEESEETGFVAGEGAVLLWGPPPSAT